MRGNLPGRFGNGDRHDDSAVGIELVFEKGVAVVEELCRFQRKREIISRGGRVEATREHKMLLSLHEDTPPKQVYVIHPA